MSAPPMNEATGDRYAVATPHAEATRVAERILADGGNALDAAVAASAVLTVVYPHMCAVGGDAIVLAATPDGEVRVLNGSGAAPRAASAERCADADGQMPVTGPHTVTVPGAVAAWESLRELGATASLAALLEPAVRLAREGTAVAPSLARALAEEDHLRQDPGLAEIFFPDGRALAAGDLVRQPALAASLAAIGAEGPGALYGGDVGERFVAGLAALGSTITLDDLRAHRTELVAPLVGSFGDDEIITAQPNSQGLLLLEVLAALDELGPGDYLGADADLLSELFRLTAGDRDRHLADPRVVPVPTDRLLGPEHVAELAAAARRRREAATAPEPVVQQRPSGDTIALTVADASGHAVVVIQSVFHSFGAGLLEPGTGIVCHNRGAFFTLDPAAPNVLAGGKRPAHTLMPVMVRRGGRLVGLHGTMGGKAQPQIHAQLLLRLLEDERPGAALAAPRWVVGGLDVGTEDHEVHAEASVADAATAAFGRAGFPLHPLPDETEEVGHAQLVRIGPDGGFRAASDPRSDGAAAAG